MIVSLTAGIAYLAMPKTGSTAIESVLAPECDIVMSGHPKLKHMRLRRFERFVRPLLKDAQVETVAVIREPLDWLGSWYRYRARPQIAGSPNSTAGIGFDRFVRDWLSRTPPPHARVGRPADFLAAPQGGPGLAHLFRYDDFAALEALLSERFGRALALPRHNVSPVMDLALTPETRARAMAALAEDYAIYEGAASRARAASIDRLT